MSVLLVFHPLSADTFEPFARCHRELPDGLNGFSAVFGQLKVKVKVKDAASEKGAASILLLLYSSHA